MKALIVDDSLLSRNTVKKLLDTDRFAVTEAVNGREALAILAEQQFDIVFLDLLMPELDGYQVLQTMQQRGLTTPVAVLTADIQDSTKKRVMELGAGFFINKPANQKSISAVLSQLFGG